MWRCSSWILHKLFEVSKVWEFSRNANRIKFLIKLYPEWRLSWNWLILLKIFREDHLNHRRLEVISSQIGACILIYKILLYNNCPTHTSLFLFFSFFFVLVNYVLIIYLYIYFFYIKMFPTSPNFNFFNFWVKYNENSFNSTCAIL